MNLTACRYVTAFYYIIITMITVGYGDIHPITYVEKVLMVIVCLLSCCVFAYILNKIGKIVQSLTKLRSKFENRMYHLIKYMQQRELSFELQCQIKKYFEHINDEEKNKNQPGEDIFNQLTGHIKEIAQREIYTKVIANIKFLQLNFSQDFLNNLSLLVREQRINPGDVLYEENHEQDKLYVILSGDMEVYIQSRSQSKNVSLINTLSKGSLLGLESFISGHASNHSSRSLNVVQLAYIERRDFLELMKGYALDFEVFHKLRTSLIFYKQSAGLDLKCTSCQLYNHQSILECPFLFNSHSAYRTIKKYLINDKPQERRLHKRSEKRFINCYCSLDVVMQTVINYLVANANEEEEYEEFDNMVKRIRNQNKSKDQPEED